MSEPMPSHLSGGQSVRVLPWHVLLQGLDGLLPDQRIPLEQLGPLLRLA
jgi:hypothetical protein